MFKSIKHRLNNYKTNPSTFVYEIDRLNEDVLNPLNVNKEGIYGIELLYQKEHAETYIIAPSWYTGIDGNISHQDWNMLRNTNHLHGYEIGFQQQSFMPLGESDFPLWEYLKQLGNSHVDIMAQLLIYNGQKNWKQNWIDQYIHWMQGNDFPSESKWGRQIQSKLLQGTNRLKRNEIGHKRNPHIEYKIQDYGYKFSFRLLLHGNNGTAKVIEDEINEILSNWDFFNQLRLYEVGDIEGFIDQWTNREMNVRTNQILSETELMSLFMSDAHSTLQNNDNYNKKTIQVNKVDQLHSGLELLPRNDSASSEIDTSIGDSIVGAIRELGLVNKNQRFTIIDQIASSSVQKIVTNIPKGTKYTDIKKNEGNIKASLGYHKFVIEQGDAPGTISFYIPSRTREVVYLRNLLENKQFQQSRKNMTLPVVIGIDTLGELLIIDIAKLPHLLIASATGGGKSFFILCLLLTLILYNDPSNLQLYLIDPKKVELKFFKGFPQVGDNVVTDANEAIQLLEKICIEMDRRYDEFSKVGVRNITGYNEKFPKKKMPYIVTVIDELSDLMMISGKEVEDYIVRIAQLARASGIHLIIATQRPDKDVVTGIIKANIEPRIAFSVSDQTNSRIILDQKGAEELLGHGDGLAKKLKGLNKELVRFQSPAITLDELELDEIMEQLKKMMNRDKVDNNDIEIVKSDDKQGKNEESDKDKLMRIIDEHDETRVMELQKLMGISSNKVNAMMKELVEDGYLTREGRSYIRVR